MARPNRYHNGRVYHWYEKLHCAKPSLRQRLAAAIRRLLCGG